MRLAERSAGGGHERLSRRVRRRATFRNMSTPFTLEADEVTSLPVDHLALLILRDQAGCGDINPGNWVENAKRGYGANSAALPPLAEAWSWLDKKGLLARHPWHQGEEWRIITRLGREVLVQGLAHLRAVERLDLDMHPILEAEARPQFLMGRHDLAAFAAMKAVEVRVRTMAGAPNSVLGTKLMQEVFKPTGVLTDTTVDGGEQVAMMELFKGAIGLFKNPSSHREVKFEDITVASEVVLLADLLMRLLDEVAARIGS